MVKNTTNDIGSSDSAQKRTTTTNTPSFESPNLYLKDDMKFIIIEEVIL